MSKCASSYLIDHASSLPRHITTYIESDLICFKKKKLNASVCDTFLGLHSGYGKLMICTGGKESYIFAFSFDYFPFYNAQVSHVFSSRDHILNFERSISVRHIVHLLRQF